MFKSEDKILCINVDRSNKLILGAIYTFKSYRKAIMPMGGALLYVRELRDSYDYFYEYRFIKIDEKWAKALYA